MALNRSFIGRTQASDEIIEVGRERLRDFVIAIDDPDPAYLDGDAAKAIDHPAPVAPPTFATTLWFRSGVWPLSDPAFGKRKEPWFLLGDQHTTHHRPILLGDRLRFATTVRDIRTVGVANELLEMEHRITTVDGELVCVIVDQMISRGSALLPPDGAAPPGADPAQPGRTGTHPGSDA